MATRDLHALDWNNKVVSQAGVRYARAFGRGIVEAGAGYALEHRFLSGRAPGQPMAFARYWFGWNPELRGRRARGALSSLPGTSWAAVGNHAPAEGRNVIAIAHVQQGVTAATLGPAALIPFVEVTLSADSAGHPWNNRRLIGEGLKARVPVGRGVIEAAAVYKHEWRSRGGESAAALTASVGLWYGWNPSKTAREN